MTEISTMPLKVNYGVDYNDDYNVYEDDNYHYDDLYEYENEKRGEFLSLYLYESMKYLLCFFFWGLMN